MDLALADNSMTQYIICHTSSLYYNKFAFKKMEINGSKGEWGSPPLGNFKVIKLNAHSELRKNVTGHK